MSEIKQRRKTNISDKPNEDQQKLDKQSALGSAPSPRSFWVDVRTAASCLSVTACVVLTWFLFQHSAQLATIQEKYHLLKQEAVKFQDMENKIELMSTKCEKTVSLVKQLEDLQLSAQVKHLQEEMDTVQTWSKNLTWAQELQQNLTSLFYAISTYEKNMASVTKNFSVKIAAVKTDIRRISGLEADVTLLLESLHAIEDKVDKAEKTTIQSIGNLLTNSIDRTAKLQSSASENERQLMLIKTKLSELTADIDKQSNKLLDLESDRAKVLKTVAFANDLKPKVYNLRKDFAHLEPMIDELTLRIGRLVGDLLERQKEIAHLYKELPNLTSVQNEVNTLNNEIIQVSNLS